MDRVGVSFFSRQSPDEVRAAYVRPLRKALEAARGGVFSNYLHQDDSDGEQPAEHLLMFEVHDFRDGLRILRTEIQRLGQPDRLALHNLNASDLPY